MSTVPVTDNGSINEADLDPTAEFLAREQETLAGLIEDDHVSVTSNGHLETNGSMNGHSDSEDRGLGSSLESSNKPEPETIRVWREEQKQLLDQKDAEESVKREEMKVGARKELEEFYKKYAEQVEKSKTNNREACKAAEKEWIKERDSEKPGEEWEKIAKMCDFNPKSARNTKDTSRMRSILLQLKQSPPASMGSASPPSK